MFSSLTYSSAPCVDGTSNLLEVSIFDWVAIKDCHQGRATLTFSLHPHDVLPCRIRYLILTFAPKFSVTISSCAIDQKMVTFICLFRIAAHVFEIGTVWTIYRDFQKNRRLIAIFLKKLYNLWFSFQKLHKLVKTSLILSRFVSAINCEMISR